MFRKLNEGTTFVICEECYRIYYYGQDLFVKAYKHCILSDAITPAVSRSICHCSKVPHFDNSGRSRTLFPVGKEENHINIDGTGGIQCGILKLGELVALAKYDGIQTVMNKRKKSSNAIRTGSGQKKDDKAKKTGFIKVAGRKKRRLSTVIWTSLHDSTQRIANSSASTAVDEAEADEDIPFFFRRYTEKFPFGNVHMALRVGPLVIENGVAQ